MLRASALRTSTLLSDMTSVQASSSPPTLLTRFFVYPSMNSFQGCTGAIKWERSLPLPRLPLRSKGAARVHGDTGGSTVDTELRPLLGEFGLPPSTRGRLRWVAPLGVGNANPREFGRFDIKEPDLVDSELGVGTPEEPDLVDTEQGVGTPVLPLSSLSQLLLRLYAPPRDVVNPGKTLALPPRSLLRSPIGTIVRLDLGN